MSGSASREAAGLLIQGSCCFRRGAILNKFSENRDFIKKKKGLQLSCEPKLKF
jgi:hypothetical protein